MHTQSKRKNAPRSRTFWRKKVALLRYMEAFHAAESLSHLLSSLRDLLFQEFEAAEVVFSLIDVRRDRLFYQMPESLAGRPVILGEGSSGQALHRGETLLLRASDGSPLRPNFFNEGLSLPVTVTSVLAAPLVRDGRALGSVELLGRPNGHEFGEPERQYLDALRFHMAIAVNHFVLGEEARRRRQEEAVLREIGRTLNASFSLNEILDEILKHLQDLIPYHEAAVVLFPNAEREHEMTVLGYGPQDRERLIHKVEALRHLWMVSGPEPLLVSGDDPGGRFERVRSESCSEVLIPLRSSDQLVGVLVLAHRTADAYSSSDLELLDLFGNQATLAIDRARLHESLLEKTQLEQELRIAREIQLRFLPDQMPKLSGVDLAARHVASRLVSGDYYDLIPISNGQWGIVIGDVSGKGISAGLIMSAFRASLLAEIRNNFNIATILAKVNRLLWETTGDNRFVTAFYGVLDEGQRVLTFSNAGHNPPLLLRQDGQAEWLLNGGTILGAFPVSTYVEERVHLQAGDTLVLYTDGLTEATGESEMEFGMAGIEEVIRRNQGRTAAEIADELVRTVQNHSHTGIPDDDATLLVIRLSPAER